MSRLMRRISAVTATIILILGSCLNVSATEIAEYPLVMLDNYTITDEKIVPGEDFTLSMYLKNYSSHTVTNVWIDVTNPSGVAPVYGKVSQTFVGDMEPGETREVSLEYNSWTAIYADTLDFYLSIRADQTSNYVNMRIPVGTDSPFSILSTVLPSEAVTGEMTNASISFKVLGNENVRDVSMIVKENDTVLSRSSIGIMTPGATKTHNVSFMLDGLASHRLQVVLEYNDEADQMQEVVVAETTVNVKEKTKVSSDPMGSPEGAASENTDSNMAILGIGGILILLLCVSAMIVFKKK